MPFAAGTQFEVHQRDTSSANPDWKLESASETLKVDADKTARLVSDGKESEPFTFHRIGADLYIVQSLSNEGAGRNNAFAYSVLIVREREALHRALRCESVDAFVFEALGGTVSRTGGVHGPKTCVLDGVTDSTGFLKGLAVQARPGVELRYVPVSAK